MYEYNIYRAWEVWWKHIYKCAQNLPRKRDFKPVDHCSWHNISCTVAMNKYTISTYVMRTYNNAQFVTCTLITKYKKGVRPQTCVKYSNKWKQMFSHKLKFRQHFNIYNLLLAVTNTSQCSCTTTLTQVWLLPLLTNLYFRVHGYPHHLAHCKHISCDTPCIVTHQPMQPLVACCPC